MRFGTKMVFLGAQVIAKMTVAVPRTAAAALSRKIFMVSELKRCVCQPGPPRRRKNSSYWNAGDERSDSLRVELESRSFLPLGFFSHTVR